MSSDLADARRHLQSRVALYLKVLFLITATFMGVFTLGAVINAPEDVFRPGNLGGYVLIVGALAAWHYCRSGSRPVLKIHGVEGAGTIFFCCASTLLSFDIPIEAAPDLIGALIVFCVLTLRAALVPSTARRTFAIGLFSALPLVLVAFYRYPSIPLSNAVSWQGIFLARAVLWGFAAVTVTTVTSSVIYGLQTRVQEAMQLGQYSLDEKLGEGGMGSVYRGTHQLLRRPTAVKLLPPEKAGEENIARFEREVVETSRLAHPNTVAIYDFGRTPDGIFYYAMEYLDGFSLEELIELEGPQSPERVVHLLVQAASSLVEAHEAGLVHRDIKPANIMTTRRGGIDDFVKVLDFGLVKHAEVGGDVALTRDDALTGTPHYMAPESVTQPDLVDARTDIYALGAVGYALLTGKPVFDGANLVEVLSKHLHEEPLSPSSRGVEVPQELEDTIMRCLAKDPSKRIRSAAALKAALADVPGSSWAGERARRWWLENAEALRRRRGGGGTASKVVVTGSGYAVQVDLGNRPAR